MRRTIILALWFCAISFAAEQTRPPLPDEVEALRDVEYCRVGEKPLKLDIYRPKKSATAPMPVVVWIHGGAWREGDKADGGPHLIPLVQRGYFGASVQYRLTPEAPFPAQIEDCKCAIRYLRAHAEQYHIDPDRIGVWGASAGGHLVALLGASGGAKDLEGSGGWERQSSKVQAVCDWFGPSDLAGFVDWKRLPPRAEPPGVLEMLMGGPLAENKEKLAKASPVTYVSGDDPPFLIMHGTLDKLVPYQQSVLLADALKTAGVSAELVSIEGAGHGGPQFSSENRKRILDFFDKNLKAPAAAK